MNVGLPVFTGFPLCVSWPLEDTRRFFTKPEKDKETESKWLQDMVLKAKASADPASLPI